MPFIRNFSTSVDVAATPTAVGAVFDISDIIQFLDHDKSRSISQLIKNKSKDLQKLLKYFNELKHSF